MTASTNATRLERQPGELRELAADIRARHRALLREFRIEEVSGGVALHGFAYSFYGKQIAQHEILRRGDLTIVANSIVVG
jgi:hypothetical protein